jgi:hypothetical protein
MRDNQEIVTARTIVETRVIGVVEGRKASDDHAKARALGSDFGGDLQIPQGSHFLFRALARGV